MGNKLGNKRTKYIKREPVDFPTVLCECGEIYYYSYINHSKYNLQHKRWIINNICKKPI